MTDDSLFPIEDYEPPKYVNKFEPAPLTNAERNRRIAEQPKLNQMVSDNHPDTSREAALKARAGLKGLRAQILDLLDKHPEGLNTSEICQILGKEKPSISPRPGELIALGLVYEDGVRKTNAGGTGTVYKAVKVTHD